MIDDKRVLIADDDEDLVEIIAQRCLQAGLQIGRAHDGVTALQEIDALDPDLVILDVNMPGGTGLRVCEMISHDPFLKSIPVIMLTGRKDGEIIRDCELLRAFYVPKGPDVWSRLESLLADLLGIARRPEAAVDGKSAENLRRADDGHLAPLPRLPNGTRSDAVNFLRAEQGTKQSAQSAEELETDSDQIRNHYIDTIFSALGWNEAALDNADNDDRPRREIVRPWVLCVDDDPEFANSLKLRLQMHGIDLLQAFTGMAGYRYAFTSEAQAIILDNDMPDGNGDYVLRRLKENPVTQDIPVIVLTGRKDQALARRMYNLGAARFLNKPPNWDELWTELRRHIHSIQEPVGAWSQTPD